MIKPDRETIQRMIEKFEDEIMVAQGCISVLRMEMWKLDTAISTQDAPYSAREGFYAIHGQQEGKSDVLNKKKSDLTLIPADTIHQQNKELLDKDYSKDKQEVKE